MDSYEVDLLSILPSVRLETQSWGNGKKVEDEALINHFDFCGSKIFSLKYLKDNQDILPENYVGYLDYLEPRLIDADGDVLDDFTIILDQKEKLDIRAQDKTFTRELICYLSYVDKLDNWVELDLVSVVCYPKGGRSIYLNNKRELFGQKYLYVLPSEQNHIHNLRIRKDYEESIIKTFAHIKEKKQDFFLRIYQSISLFNDSCRMYPSSESSAIVLLCAAFEALYQIPKRSKKDTFSYAFKLFWGLDDRIEKWAGELYDLRSKVVHGGVVIKDHLLASSDKHYPHFEIGREIFNDSLLFVLEAKGTLGLEYEYKSRIQEELRNKVISNKEKADDLLKGKDRYTYAAFLNNDELYKEFLTRIESFSSLDYSASEQVFKIIKIFLSILADWIQFDLHSQKEKHGDYQEYLEWRAEQYNKALDIIQKLTGMKSSNYQERYKIEKELSELRQIFRGFEPISHKKDEFKFSISEYVERFISAIWGTYI